MRSFGIVVATLVVVAVVLAVLLVLWLMGQFPNGVG